MEKQQIAGLGQSIISLLGLTPEQVSPMELRVRIAGNKEKMENIVSNIVDSRLFGVNPNLHLAIAMAISQSLRLGKDNSEDMLAVVAATSRSFIGGGMKLAQRTAGMVAAALSFCTTGDGGSLMSADEYQEIFGGAFTRSFYEQLVLLPGVSLDYEGLKGPYVVVDAAAGGTRDIVLSRKELECVIMTFLAFKGANMFAAVLPSKEINSLYMHQEIAEGSFKKDDPEYEEKVSTFLGEAFSIALRYVQLDMSIHCHELNDMISVYERTARDAHPMLAQKVISSSSNIAFATGLVLQDLQHPIRLALIDFCKGRGLTTTSARL